MKRVVALHAKRSRPGDADGAAGGSAAAPADVALPSLYDDPLFVAGGSRVAAPVAGTGVDAATPGASGPGTAGEGAGVGAGAGAKEVGEEGVEGSAGAAGGVPAPVGLSEQPEADLAAITALFKRKRARVGPVPGAGGSVGQADAPAPAPALDAFLDWRGRGFQ